MTEQKVLTARAWVYLEDEAIEAVSMPCGGQSSKAAIAVYIPGLTHDQMESDILAGLSLLAKSREVCEWRVDDSDVFTECGQWPSKLNPPSQCWCGRHVKIIGDFND